MTAKFLLGFTLLAASLRAAPPLDAARTLMQQKHFPEACAELEKLVAAEPKNAAAWHQLGLAWKGRSDSNAYEQAVACLERAVAIEPDNAEFVADLGGTLMEVAERTRSIGAATRGRDTMERAIKLNPDNLDAREGLYQFYVRAPFLVGGSSKKAANQLEEIRRRNPDRATVLEVIGKANEKKFNEAFALCDAVLAKQPDNYVALYQFGRTASVSGQNLERGLTCLQRVLTLEPPSPSSPKPTHAWFRIGDIQEKLGHAADAREAYQTALKLDPANRQAATALARAFPDTKAP